MSMLGLTGCASVYTIPQKQAYCQIRHIKSKFILNLNRFFIFGDPHFLLKTPKSLTPHWINGCQALQL